MDPWELLERTSLHAYEMAKAFGALQGYVMNAIIDLETGTKADAIRTLRAGQKIVADYQATMPKPPETPSHGETQ